MLGAQGRLETPHPGSLSSHLSKRLVSPLNSLCEPVLNTKQGKTLREMNSYGANGANPLAFVSSSLFLMDLVQPTPSHPSLPAVNPFPWKFTHWLISSLIH